MVLEIMYEELEFVYFGFWLLMFGGIVFSVFEDDYG